MKNNVVVYSTVASEYFANLIANGLGLKSLGGIERKTFGDGEKYLRVEGERGHLLGKTVIIVGSTHSDEAFNDLTDIAEACHEARQKIFVIPFFGYSTMERAVKAGEVVKAKKNARILSNIPAGDLRNVFLMFDLHASGMLHYFEGECLAYETYGGETFAAAIEELFWKNYFDEDIYEEELEQVKRPKINDVIKDFSVKFVSADLGRPQWVKYYSKEFNTGEIAVIDKDRDGAKTEIANVVGNVECCDCIIYDDMSRSFGTLIDAVIAYLRRHANSVGAILSNLAVYGDEIVAKIEDSPLRFVLVSNSHPMSQLASVKRSKKIIVVDISHLFVAEIEKILRIS